jgi:hypothetical protein
MGNQLRAKFRHTHVVPHHNHHASPLHGRHRHCCSSLPRPDSIIALSILAPVPHLRQPTSSTAPTQQHIPPTHCATRQHTSPSTTSEGDTITIATTIHLVTCSRVRNIVSIKPYASPTINHSLIISEGGANDHNQHSKTHHLGTLCHRRHSSYRHLQNRHNKPRPTWPTWPPRHHRSKERR